MGKFSEAFSYSVGKKLIVALTGLFLVLFLVEHLTGNMLLIVDDINGVTTEEASWFEAYAHFMGSFFIIRIMEIGLFAGFIAHIVMALKLNAQNDKARPVKYAVKGGSHNSDWFSRNMRATGIVMLIFLVLHLISFWFQARLGVNIDINGEDVDLFEKVPGHFSKGWYVLIYLVAMVLLGFHLNHGFQSAFQTLGWNHSKYTPIIKKTGTAFSIVVPLGFAFIPIWFAVQAITDGTFALF